MTDHVLDTETRTYRGVEYTMKKIYDDEENKVLVKFIAEKPGENIPVEEDKLYGSITFEEDLDSSIISKFKDRKLYESLRSNDVNDFDIDKFAEMKDDDFHDAIDDVISKCENLGAKETVKKVTSSYGSFDRLYVETGEMEDTFEAQHKKGEYKGFNYTIKITENGSNINKYNFHMYIRDSPEGIENPTAPSGGIVERSKYEVDELFEIGEEKLKERIDEILEKHESLTK